MSSHWGATLWAFARLQSTDRWNSPHDHSTESYMLPLSSTHLTLGLFGMPGGWEMIVVLVIGLLVFGRRLPEIGRSLGSSIVEFKKGIKGIDEEIETESRKSSSTPAQIDQSTTYSARHDPETGGEKSPYHAEQNSPEKAD